LQNRSSIAVGLLWLAVAGAAAAHHHWHRHGRPPDDIGAIATELSEGGARLVVDGVTPSRGEFVSGDIRFADGAVFGIVGTVVRHETDEAILKLDLGIPLRRMLSEQKWVHRNYPDLRDDPG